MEKRLLNKIKFKFKSYYGNWIKIFKSAIYNIEKLLSTLISTLIARNVRVRTPKLFKNTYFLLTVLYNPKVCRQKVSNNRVNRSNKLKL